MFIYFYHGEVLRVHNLSILVSPRNLVVYRRDNCISMGVGHRKSAQTQRESVCPSGFLTRAPTSSRAHETFSLGNVS